MELRVNDYVRTKNGLIAKIININDFREPSLKYGIEANYIVDIGFIGDEDIKISSPNIIDLIEVGDYVNGYKVVEIGWYLPLPEEQQKYLKVDCSRLFNALYVEDIKSIVTHEQFKKREFKVGD